MGFGRKSDRVVWPRICGDPCPETGVAPEARAGSCRPWWKLTLRLALLGADVAASDGDLA